MGFALEEGGAISSENKLIAFWAIRNFVWKSHLAQCWQGCEVKESSIIWLGDKTEQQIITSDQSVN